MAFRGGGRGFGGGGGRGGGGGFRGGRGGGFGGGRGGYDQGPPDTVVPIADFSHACENDIVAYISGGKVPLLARSMYTADKKFVGKIDDVFGNMNTPGIVIKPDQGSGIQASSFKEGDKVSHETLLYRFYFERG